MSPRIVASLFVLLLASPALALTDDGGVGTLRDPVGGVTVRFGEEAAGRMVAEGQKLKAGTLLEVDSLVPGAVALELPGTGTLLLGPGARLKAHNDGTLVWIAGPLVAKPAKGAQLALKTWDGAAAQFAVETHADLVGKEIQKQPKGFPWAEEYLAGRNLTPMGRLFSEVDGHKVELALVRHSVMVEIRDGLALTTIDSTYANNSTDELEAIFEFPLPQDAAIADFGVWEGDRLVLADIAEKSLARRAYQTLMAEKKSPALLEVVAGNLFRTRVYPIYASSQKKVRIAYTQLLPRTASTIRYSYPLVSDATASVPLEELLLRVVVSSQRRLLSARSLDHPVAVELSDHALRVEYSAKKVTPSSDFDLLIETEVVEGEPLEWTGHVRGNDGYFVASKSLKAQESAGVVSGDVLLWLDSSASMGGASRKKQRDIALGLLHALPAKARFRLAMCDAGCIWMSEAPTLADDAGRKLAAQYIDKATYLGWTDLGESFSQVLKAATPETHIVYLGDGMESRTVHDSAAVIADLARISEGMKAKLSTFSVSSAADALVLQSMASHGKGRHYDGLATATEAVASFIDGASWPSRPLELRGIGVSLGAVSATIVQPSGGDAIYLWTGRFEPVAMEEGARVQALDEAGNVVAEVALPAKGALGEGAQEDASMLMRFWARRYIDTLLTGAPSEATVAEVIGLSEEYGVLSPYTSFIVVDSDQERKRFGIKRLFRMGNGERFFAKGRSDAEKELQSKAAVAGQRWRRELVERLSGRYMRPDKLSRQFLGQVVSRGAYWEGPVDVVSSVTLTGGATGWGRGGGGLSDFRADLGGEMDGAGGDYEYREEALEPESGAYDTGVVPPEEPMPMLEPSYDSLDGPPMVQPAAAYPVGDFEESDKFDSASGEFAPLGEAEATGNGLFSGGGLGDETMAREMPAQKAKSRFASGYADWSLDGKFSMEGSVSGAVASLVPGLSGLGQPQDPWWVAELLPYQIYEPAPRPSVKEAVDSGPTWPEEVVTLLESAGRAAWASENPGVHVDLRVENHGAWSGGMYSLTTGSVTLAQKRWITRTRRSNSPDYIQWNDGKLRGALNAAYMTGRVRASAPGDTPPWDIVDRTGLWSPLTSLASTFQASIRGSKEKPVVELVATDGSKARMELEVDAGRSLVVAVRNYSGKQLLNTYEVAKAELIGTVWMPSATRYWDESGYSEIMETMSWKLLDAEGVKNSFAELEQARGAFLELQNTTPSVLAARGRKARGEATLSDHFALFSWHSNAQRFDEALTELGAMESIAKGKVAISWLRLATFGQARRHDEVLPLMEKLVAHETGTGRSPSLHVGTYLYRTASGILRGKPLVEFASWLKPFYVAAVPPERGEVAFREVMISAYETASMRHEARALRHETARDFPDEPYAQTGYAWSLSQEGRSDEALDWLEASIKHFEGRKSQQETLLTTRLDIYQNRWDGEGLLKAARRWMETADSESSQAYGRYLASLEASGQGEEAKRVAGTWMSEALALKEVPTGVTAGKLQAAVNMALGYGYIYSYGRVVKELAPKVAQVAHRAAVEEGWQRYAGQTRRHAEFSASKEGRELRERLWKHLAGAADSYSWERLYGIVEVISDLKALTAEERQSVLKLAQGGVAKLYGAARGDLQWFHALVNLVAANSAELRGPYLDTVRSLHKAMSGEELADAREQFFYTLVGGRPRIEDMEEARSLLPMVGARLEGTDRLSSRLAAVERLSMAWELAGAQECLKGAGGENRKARAGQRSKCDRQGRLDAAKAMANKEGMPEEIAALMRLRELALRVGLGQQLSEALAEGTLLMAQKSGARKQAFDEALIWLESAANIAAAAAVRSGDPASVAKVVELMKAAASDAATEEEELAWRVEIIGLLLASGEMETLEKFLVELEKGGPGGVSWSAVRAGIRAERGDASGALKLLEQASDTPLDAAGAKLLRSLSQAMPDAAAGQKGRIQKSLSQLSEWDLQNRIGVEVARLQREGGNARASDELVALFKALFKAAPYPSNYAYQAGTAFNATQDGRLLVTLLEALPGMTAQEASQFVTNLQYQFRSIQTEAALEQVMKEVSAALKGASDDGAKRRINGMLMSLDVVGLAVSGHFDDYKGRLLKRMEVATAGVSDAGEAAGLVALLYGLGGLEDEELEAKRVAVAKGLLSLGAPASPLRLEMAVNVANMHYGDKASQEGVMLLMTELASRLEATGYYLDYGEYSALDTLVAIARTQPAMTDLELYLAKMEEKAPSYVKGAIAARFIRLAGQAVAYGFALSPGSGQELVKAVFKVATERLADANSQVVSWLMAETSQAVRSAVYRGIRTPKELGQFLEFLEASVLPVAGERWYEVLGAAAAMVADVQSKVDALRYVLKLRAKVPTFRPYYESGLMGSVGYQLDQWVRGETLPKDVEKQLLDLLLAETSKELETGRTNNRWVVMQMDGGAFVAKHKDAFVKAARDAAELVLECSSCTLFVAAFVEHDLARPVDAAQILAKAHARQPLEPYALEQLIRLWNSTGASAKALQAARQLMVAYPKLLNPRTQYIVAALKTGKSKDAAKVLRETVADWKRRGAWNHEVAAVLAHAVSQGPLWNEAVALFGESISLLSEAGGGPWLMANRLYGRADAHTSGAKYKPALDDILAALSACPSCAASNGQRAEDKVRSLMEIHPSLPELMAQIRKDEAQSGLVSPMLHRIAAQVFTGRRDWTAAIDEFSQAVEARPTDSITWGAFIDMLWESGQQASVPDWGMAAMMSGARLQPDTVKIISQALTEVREHEKAFRCLTTIVEWAPDSASARSRLAAMLDAKTKMEEVVNQWAMAVKLAPKDGALALSYANALIQAGQKQKAGDFLRSLLGEKWVGGQLRVQLEELLKTLK